MRPIIDLALAFAQVGIGAFGGGLSSLPLIEYQLVTSTGWLTTGQFNRVLAVSQVTPGPIAINAATFVGFQQAGFLGSLIATLALVSAPLVLLSIVMLLLRYVSAEKNKRFKALLRPVVAGLLSLSLVPPLIATWNSGVISILLFITGLFFLKFCRFFRENPPVMLIIFGIAGAILL